MQALWDLIRTRCRLRDPPRGCQTPFLCRSAAAYPCFQGHSFDSIMHVTPRHSEIPTQQKWAVGNFVGNPARKIQGAGQIVLGLHVGCLSLERMYCGSADMGWNSEMGLRCSLTTYDSREGASDSQQGKSDIGSFC